MESNCEVVEHTADVGLIVQGSDLKQAFASAACGLFSLIAELAGVEGKERYRVEVKGEDSEDLLVAWLNELIYRFDVDNVLFKRFDILDLSPTRLVAEAWGEGVEPARHRIKLGVKAATYHMLKIEKDEAGYRLQVLFDI